MSEEEGSPPSPQQASKDSSPPPSSAGASVVDKILKLKKKERASKDKDTAKEKKKKRSRALNDDEPKFSRFEAVASEVRGRAAQGGRLRCNVLADACRHRAVTKRVMWTMRSARWRNTTAK